MDKQMEFINKIKDVATQTQKEYKIFASVTISQAILESGWGESSLAKTYNNLFGIKALRDWDGPVANMETKEWTRNGTITVKQPFRIYNSWAESILDHAKFLQKEWYTEAGVFTAKDYIEQINAIFNGGYTTDPNYVNKILDLIDKYHLNKFDVRGSNNMRIDNIAVRGGHNFKALGANGIISETIEDRKVKDAVIKYLKTAGKNVIDVTPGDMDSNSDLNYGVSKANNWGADLFVSIHFNNAYNSYNGALGTETWTNTNNTTGKDIAQTITNNIANLGFKNRGVKDGITRGLFEIKHTSMSAIIVEVCFVEATKDIEIYKNIGYDKIGKAIAEGILGHSISSIQAQVKEFKPLLLKMQYDTAAVFIRDEFMNIAKFFYRDQLVTAIDEKLEFYLLDIEGIKAWIPKKATCLR
ncbi:cell wall-binding protein [Clostridium botulinum C]|uniref:Cell wall-binding protein n=2 Tax=Clostridium botulinum TaxID=1491 RepID=A0A9Q4TLA0_CLOBO|nr:glucosaminidase domain-containing protein [Clostridium botulinum]EGO86284.1 cell wall-binding protein [Clostridium botulinum C str. Stockholm]MCD3195760.1 cell wall-binding protein [Clostridium botulinum C]MCD3201176.1 cell wall-binding protein [Clostridium botulinum C]MCD3206654.1 cell wall-binding protein [Clostridium botulinum C]MCD3209347.1 cell wall-binding protein [Clostridium botulinum C]